MPTTRRHTKREHDRNKAAQMALSGHSLQAIAAEVGVCKETVAADLRVCRERWQAASRQNIQEWIGGKIDETTQLAELVHEELKQQLSNNCLQRKVIRKEVLDKEGGIVTLKSVELTRVYPTDLLKLLGDITDRQMKLLGVTTQSVENPELVIGNLAEVVKTLIQGSATSRDLN